MKTILIGSVVSSKVMLEEMINAKFPINMVFSLDEKYSKNVSGYRPIHEVAAANNIPLIKFRNINDEENIEIIKKVQPDYIFVIGLSQLIDNKILKIANKGTIGLHPTPLPKYRGRAAMVWQVLLGERESKVSLFMIDEGMDSGDIIGQEDYFIEETDYAEDLEKKSLEALRKLSKRVLPDLMNDSIVPIPQNDNDATYLLIRRPEDGQIDWNQSVSIIHRLIRAVSRPYPGAFGMYDGIHKLIIWRADVVENKNIIGIPGQICAIGNNYFDILGKDGIIRVTDFENTDNVKLYIGHKLK